MVIALIGGRCCGKSALAKAICDKVHAEVYTGCSYRELAPEESDARQRFRTLLAEAQYTEDFVIYLVTDKALLSVLPERCLRVLCKAQLKTVKERFAAQMGEPLSFSMSAMLERQYNSFDDCAHSLRLDPTADDPQLLAVQVLEAAKAMP